MWSVVMRSELTWYMWSDFVLKWSEVSYVEVLGDRSAMYIRVTLYLGYLIILWPYGIVHMLYCVCFNLYCVFGSEVCHPRCVFKLYGEVNSVKNTTMNIWLNDGVYKQWKYYMFRPIAAIFRFWQLSC